MVFLIEWIDERRVRLRAPLEARVTNNAQEPGAAIPAGKGPEIAKRTQRCLLHGVFGIVLVMQQPAGQAERGPKVRHHDLVKVFRRGDHRRARVFVI